MEQYIFDESNGLWYQRSEATYISCLALTDDEDYQIGKWGQEQKQKSCST